VRRDVLVQTGFAKPTDFGRHQVWSYIGPGTEGRGNPSGRVKPFQTYEELLTQAVEPSTTSTELVRADAFADHLVLLGQTAVTRQPTLRADLHAWADCLREADLAVSQQTRVLVVALAAISTLTMNIGASWRMIVRDDQ
jgi:hypothetical protein